MIHTDAQPITDSQALLDQLVAEAGRRTGPFTRLATRRPAEAAA